MAPPFIGPRTPGPVYVAPPVGLKTRTAIASPSRAQANSKSDSTSASSDSGSMPPGGSPPPKGIRGISPGAGSATTIATVDLDDNVQPRGYRLLSRIPRLPESVVERIVGQFGSLQKIMRATIDDLDDVTGVGQVRARAIKDGLARLAESSILDRYS